MNITICLLGYAIVAVLAILCNLRHKRTDKIPSVIGWILNAGILLVLANVLFEDTSWGIAGRCVLLFVFFIIIAAAEVDNWKEDIGQTAGFCCGLIYGICIFNPIIPILFVGVILFAALIFLYLAW